MNGCRDFDRLLEDLADGMKRLLDTHAFFLWDANACTKASLWGC
jgi:hypothetical protein